MPDKHCHIYLKYAKKFRNVGHECPIYLGSAKVSDCLWHDSKTITHPRRITTRRGRHRIGTPVLLVQQIGSGNGEIKLFVIPAQRAKPGRLADAPLRA